MLHISTIESSQAVTFSWTASLLGLLDPENDRGTVIL